METTLREGVDLLNRGAISSHSLTCGDGSVGEVVKEDDILEVYINSADTNAKKSCATDAAIYAAAQNPTMCLEFGDGVPEAVRTAIIAEIVLSDTDHRCTVVLGRQCAHGLYRSVSPPPQPE